MKKTIILLAISFVILSMSPILCQAQEQKPIQFGVKGGINLSDLYTSDASRSDMLAGVTLGVFDKLPLTNMIALQPEFYVTTKGASITYNSLLLDGTAKFNLTYLEVPLLCEVQVTHYIHVEFGPYLAYLIDGKVKNVANINLFNYEQNMNVNDYNRFDAGVALGAGVDVGTITMGARYNLGMTKVGKTRTFLGTNYTIPNANNGVINFYLAVAL